MRRALAAAAAAWLGAAGTARAQDAGAGVDPAGGADAEQTCPVPPDVPRDRLLALAEEHLVRGGTLYLQGDYEGAIRENVASLCLVPELTDVLYNIGQSHERLLQFERAIAYYERYAAALGSSAASERAGVEARVEVLRKLPARVQVTTSPPGATVTLVDAQGVRRNLGRAGSAPFQVIAGRYTMTLELAGHESRTERLDAKIGQPYSFYVPLQPLRGRLAITTDPADARIFVDDRLVGIGRYGEALPGGRYAVTVEAAGRSSERRTVEVAARRDTALTIRLPTPVPSGRRWLLAGTTIGGGMLGGVTLGALDADTAGQGALGFLLGLGAGGVGGAFAIPSYIPQGRANYIITAGLIGLLEGGYLASALTSDRNDVEDAVGAAGVGGMAVGAAFAAFTAARFDPDPGDAALLNSGAVWGAVTGGLFTVVFDSTPRLGATLVLGGLNLGVVTGALLAGRATVSRRRVALIDLAGLAGMGVAVALKGVVDSARDAAPSDDGGESAAHFALAGLASGLGLGAYLTRNLDAPQVAAVTPLVSSGRDAAGTAVPVFGVGVRW